jgi:hypothetical protein
MKEMLYRCISVSACGVEGSDITGWRIALLNNGNVPVKIKNMMKSYEHGKT